MTAHLLTVPQVAEHLQQPVYTVRKLIRSRALIAVNVGTPARPQYRVEQDALEAFVEARRTQPLTVVSRRRAS